MTNINIRTILCRRTTALPVYQLKAHPHTTLITSQSLACAPQQLRERTPDHLTTFGPRYPYLFIMPSQSTAVVIARYARMICW